MEDIFRMLQFVNKLPVKNWVSTFNFKLDCFECT
jgi:hypothetical protein